MKLAFSITLLFSFGYTSAFHTPFASRPILMSTATKTTLLPQPHHTTTFKADTNTKLLMSSEEKDKEEDDGPISDELSKLIGKRASLTSKKTTESNPTPSASQLSDEEYIDPSTASLYEGKSGMDIFEMPDFQNARPLKKSREMEDKKRGGDTNNDGKNDGEDGEFYVDFQAEFDDENDFHVPNRIGFSTRDWGDVDAGFKAGKKLKKKEIKRGKFLAGDLQVCIIISTWYYVLFHEPSILLIGMMVPCSYHSLSFVAYT